MLKSVLSLFLVSVATLCAVATEPVSPTVADGLQYESEGIAVSLPTADEPRVETFNRETILAAKQYLEQGAKAWVRERGCINCHTTGPYMSEMPGLARELGPPSVEIRNNFKDDVPQVHAEVSEVSRGKLRYMPRSYYAVWRSLGLAEWDKHVTGRLSSATERSIRDMFARQSDNGSFVTYGEVEIPHITTDFELTLQAARAVTSAPNWFKEVEDKELLAKADKMKRWLRDARPKNDFDRVLRLQLDSYFPDLVSDEERRSAIELLSSKQHTDGGWCIRDMSALEDWHYEISDYVQDLVSNLPDAAAPESDAYMTALAVVLLRQSGIEAGDPRVKRGIDWLKREQRISGRWWMHSLYRGNYHYTTYIATCQALKALYLCGELGE